jgi:hypothetical protein
MLAETSGPDWRTNSRHADSPFGLCTAMSHWPSMDGAAVATTGSATQRRADSPYFAPGRS